MAAVRPLCPHWSREVCFLGCCWARKESLLGRCGASLLGLRQLKVNFAFVGIRVRIHLYYVPVHKQVECMYSRVRSSHVFLQQHSRTGT